MITLVHTVTIVHPGSTTDRYDNDVDDWTTATRTEAAAWVQQRSTGEDRGGRQAVITGWKCFFAADAEVTARDRIEWDGRAFEVDGEPYAPSTPDGPHHVECQLKAVDG